MKCSVLDKTDKMEVIDEAFGDGTLEEPDVLPVPPNMPISEFSELHLEWKRKLIDWNPDYLKQTAMTLDTGDLLWSKIVNDKADPPIASWITSYLYDNRDFAGLLILVLSELNDVTIKVASEQGQKPLFALVVALLSSILSSLASLEPLQGSYSMSLINRLRESVDVDVLEDESKFQTWLRCYIEGRLSKLRGDSVDDMELFVTESRSTGTAPPVAPQQRYFNAAADATHWSRHRYTTETRSPSNVIRSFRTAPPVALQQQNATHSEGRRYRYTTESRAPPSVIRSLRADAEAAADVMHSEGRRYHCFTERREQDLVIDSTKESDACDLSPGAAAGSPMEDRTEEEKEAITLITSIINGRPLDRGTTEFAGRYHLTQDQIDVAAAVYFKARRFEGRTLPKLPTSSRVSTSRIT